MDTNIDPNVRVSADGETCVVCGKTLRPGEALAKIHSGGSKLPICCPLCLDAYQRDPKPYLERLARQVFLRELQHPESSDGRPQ
jgi:hypothetical protein